MMAHPVHSELHRQPFEARERAFAAGVMPDFSDLRVTHSLRSDEGNLLKAAQAIQ
jgi:hypothetical protein